MKKQLEHMKKWALQNQDALTKDRLSKAFAQLCDDALEELNTTKQASEAEFDIPIACLHGNHCEDCLGYPNDFCPDCGERLSS